MFHGMDSSALSFCSSHLIGSVLQKLLFLYGMLHPGHICCQKPCQLLPEPEI